MHIPKTKHGGDAFELLSGLHKCLRRGEHELAMTFAAELLLSADEYKAFAGMLFNYLLTVAHEDVGVADPQAVLFVNTTVAACKQWHKDGKTTDCSNLVANCVLVICQAKKTRVGGNLDSYVRYKLATKGLPEIPDYCLDMHTRRGKALGRGQEHFEAEGQRLFNPDPAYTDDDGNDNYSRLMNPIWRKQYPGGKVAQRAAAQESPTPPAKAQEEPPPGAGEGSLFDSGEPGWQTRG